MEVSINRPWDRTSGTDFEVGFELRHDHRGPNNPFLGRVVRAATGKGIFVVELLRSGDGRFDLGN